MSEDRLRDFLSQGGPGEKDRSRERRHWGSRGGPGLFHIAIVTEFISNPANDEQFNYLVENAHNIQNSEIAPSIPRNCIVARMASLQNELRIFYPFFSPHICLPVKPGEQVWVLYPTGDLSETGYWIGRITADLVADDINFTHRDRAPSYNNQNLSLDEVDFPLGPGEDSANNRVSGLNPYKGIIDPSDPGSSVTYNSQFVGEPVPRFTKRCSDLVLQGSNNALISLGEDRTGDAYANDRSITEKGTIDIVAGRGQVGSTPRTDPDTISNTRGYSEANKSPGITNPQGSEIISEGDPSFETDSARVYVSMKTDGDANFNLEYPDTGVGSDVSSVDQDAYVISKSDQIRIISRKDGSVRIVKEGSADNDRAVITMLNDGTIMIDGPKIVVGSGINDQTQIGKGATEPLVLGDTLKSLLDAHFSDLKNFLQTIFDTHSHTSAVGPTSPPVALATFMEASISVSKTNLSSILSKVGKVK